MIEQLVIEVVYIKTLLNRRVPDAFKFCSFCTVIWIYEIEDTHKISSEKLRDYTNVWYGIHDLWFDADEDRSWQLCICVVDRYGLNKSILPMEQYFDAFAREDVKKIGKYRGAPHITIEVSNANYVLWVTYMNQEPEVSEDDDQDDLQNG